METANAAHIKSKVEDADKKRGLLLVAFAGVIWSLQGLVIRGIEVAAPSQIVFWRSIAQLTSLMIVMAVMNQGRIIPPFRRAGAVGLIGGLCGVVTSTSFIFALAHTTVANVVFVTAASPFFAAIVAWLVMRERIEARSLGSMLAAVLGIGVMISEGIGSGHLLGNLFAIASALGFAGVAVVARWGGGIDMLPAVCWGAIFTLSVNFGLSGGDIVAPLDDILLAAASGGILTAGGGICFMIGARYVPAGVLVFLSLTEIVLAPIWVWMAYDETPSSMTLIGGGIVLGAITYEGVRRARSSFA